MSPVKFPNGVYVFQNRCLFSVCVCVCMCVYARARVRVCVCMFVGAENLISTLEASKFLPTQLTSCSL
jgi:hypothetical protein